MSPCAIGLRAQKGGGVAVAVAIEQGEPRALRSAFLATHEPGDRQALEPYAVVSEMPRGPDGSATDAMARTLAEGRRRQAALATGALQGLIDRLAAEGHVVTVAALLVNRAGWITDLLGYSLGWPEHVAVAEGLGVRDALRAAIAACGLAGVEQDEKSLAQTASARLGRSDDGLAASMKQAGAALGPPWRKEQKLAFLAAWVALAP